jgi:hypothetical protein
VLWMAEPLDLEEAAAEPFGVLKAMIFGSH